MSTAPGCAVLKGAHPGTALGGGHLMPFNLQHLQIVMIQRVGGVGMKSIVHKIQAFVWQVLA